MTNAEQAQGRLPELAVLRQCLTELALPPRCAPNARQRLDGEREATPAALGADDLADPTQYPARRYRWEDRPCDP